MKYFNGIIGSVVLAFAVTLVLAADSTAQFIRLTPEQVPFRNPSGFEQAVLFGDPMKPGLYVVRVRFPPGIHSNPHSHSQDRHVTVIKGVWYMGTGETADIAKATPLKSGSYAFHPAHGVHWDGAGAEETIVQIVGLGPVETVQTDPRQPPVGSWTPPKN
ncbi:MAG TPA: cupin domain-containing protein [Steroidobacteraceae bacterium]|jgi:quercetin dioxygenase-like cupin family protein|nr:cupin domain-containing protein [Steroidobacteraceae bacterium]